jgi:hypothetical protein
MFGLGCAQKFVRVATCAALIGLPLVPRAQDANAIPKGLSGRWRVERIIPTRTITCFGEREARSIVHTEIEYSQTAFHWNHHLIPYTSASSHVLNAEQFHDDYSGGGAKDSQVDFDQLGIRSSTVTVVTFAHADVNIPGMVDGIPGDLILIKDANHIILNVCNVYLGAVRLPRPKSP